jgi:hypothetical protein
MYVYSFLNWTSDISDQLSGIKLKTHPQPFACAQGKQNEGRAVGIVLSSRPAAVRELPGGVALLYKTYEAQHQADN